MSGGKKQTYAHKYYAGWQAVLAHAGCFLRRIWVEDKEAWYGGMGNGSSRIAQQNLFGGTDVGGGGGVTGNFNYYSGSPNQTPDPYLEQKLGVGNVPASRGVCSFVWKQGYIGTSNYMKDWKFRLSYVNGIKPTFIDGVTNIVIAMDSSVSMTPEVFKIFTSGVARLMYLIADLVAVYDGSTVNIRLMFFDSGLHIKDYLNFQETDAPDAVAWIEAKTQVSGISISSMISNAESFLNAHQTENSRRIFVPMHDGRDVTPAVIAQFQAMFHNTAVHQTHTVSRADFDFIALNNLLMQADNTPEDNVDAGAYVPWAITDDAETVFNLEAWFGVRSGEPDMNPADMLWTCITNNAWGMGQPEDMLDKDSFLNAWAVLNQEDMYMSIVFDDEGEIEKIIDLICEHIDAVCTVDSRTNKWVLTLIRDDYVAGDLLILDESNVGKISDYEIRTAAEQINQITVTYWEKETGKDATVTAQDPARIAQNGLVNKSVTYDGFTNAKTAYIAAERDLKALSSPLKIVTLNNVDPDTALQLKEGNAFQWNWAAHGVDGAVMRVNSIDYGDDHNFGATIEAIEDVFSTPMNSVVPYVPPYENPANQAPLDNPRVRVLELQYYDAVQFATESEVNADLADEPTLSRVAVVAPRGQQNAMSAEIYVDSGLGYASKATLDYCPSAELAQAIGKMESTFAIRKVEDLEEIELDKWILVNDEHMAVTAISETEITVKRGVNYTVPQDHAAGSMILFCDDYIALDETDYFAGESLNVKSLTKTGSAQLALGSATAHSIEMVGLANRPYPPGDFKLNNKYYPNELSNDLSVTWATRNRVQQTGGALIGFKDGDITPEVGTTYKIEVRNLSDSSLVYQENNVTRPHVISKEDLIAGGAGAFLELCLYSVRSGYDSYFPQKAVFNWTNVEQSLQAFLTNGTFTVPPNVTSIDVLIVAGGGGGGSRQGGGGGGGGIVIVSNMTVTPGATFTVVVGAGGAGGTAGGRGITGGNSSFDLNVAIGGGGGGGRTTDGEGFNGGSGGGGANAKNGGSGIEYQGNSGGKGGATVNRGGGGGGAGLPGVQGDDTVTDYTGNAGPGGDGLYFEAFAEYGESGWFAGGGGGGGFNTLSVDGGGIGGKGGGGKGNGVGKDSPVTPAGSGVSGLANTGGGGGGSGSAANAGGNGGSGIVIISWPSGFIPPTIQAGGAISDI